MRLVILALGLIALGLAQIQVSQVPEDVLAQLSSMLKPKGSKEYKDIKWVGSLSQLTDTIVSTKAQFKQLLNQNEALLLQKMKIKTDIEDLKIKSACLIKLYNDKLGNGQLISEAVIALDAQIGRNYQLLAKITNDLDKSIKPISLTQQTLSQLKQNLKDLQQQQPKIMPDMIIMKKKQNEENFNLTTYISNSYGTQIYPAYSGQVKKLYPFSFMLEKTQNSDIERVKDGKNGRGHKFPPVTYCIRSSGKIGQIVATGIVTEINNDGFDIKRNDGAIIKVLVGICSRLNSNQENYSIKKGDEAIIKGWIQKQQTINSDLITFLS